MSPSIIKAYKILILETFFLICFGGFVRVMDAGLACPDWPLCFGDVIPDFHPQVYYEFIHRVLAGVVAIATFILNYKILRSHSVSELVKGLCWISFVLLLAQIIMGGLTVTLQLTAYVVTAHLTLAILFFASLFWIYLSISRPATDNSIQPSSIKFSAGALSLIILIQVILGGLVASHYAALVCTDFPLCHGQWIPTFRGVIGLQVIHRLGAYVTGLVVLGFFIFTRSRVQDSQIKSYAAWMLVMIVVQIVLGIANILLYTPPLLAVLHLALGIALFAVSLVNLFEVVRR